MADNIITTNITANADFTSLRTQLAAVTSQLVKLQETTAGTNAKLANQIAVMNKSFAETMRSTGQFSSHFVSLTSDVEKFGKNLDSGRLKLGQYYNAWNGHTKKTSTLIRDLAKQQVMLQNAIVQPVGKNAQGLMQYNVMVAKGLDEVKNKTAIARQELAIMNKVMLDGSNQLINWGKNTQWAGRQLTVGLTVPLMAFGAAAQKAFRAADEELVRLTKVYGGLAAVSSAELAQVRKDVSDTARELAGSYGLAFKDTIALAADLAATGQQGTELLEATRETSRLAVLGEIDRQEAMKATLAIQNAFKQNTEELSESINFLNAVENQTSTSLQDLVEAIPKAGPVVKSLGGDVQDLALYLTAMKEGGVNASEGANAIKSAMASLINPTKVAKELFTGFGIDLDSIVTSNAGNLTDTILDLQAALDTLDPLSKSRAIEQLFGKFQYARLSALFENIGREGSQTVQVMELMGASTAELAGIAERELGMITESASGKFKRALASVQADLASVGEQFLKISTKVLEVVDGIIKFFRGLPGPVKTFLNALGGLTAFAGPLIMLTGVMANFIGYVTKGIFSLRQMASGGKGFKLLTPEIIAANAAAQGLSTTFYSDAEATVVLTNAVNTLAASFDSLEMKANAAKVAVQPGISTIAGNVIAAGNPSGRMVDKNNPLIGQPYSRDMSHMIPAGSPQMGTIFGTVPGAGPVNVRIGKNPQAYMNQDLPKIPGVTSVNGISTGIVSQEAAKWHAMTAAIAMQSEAEITLLKKEVMATGTITSSLSDSYQALLPEFSEITELAAQETALIVRQLQQSKITADEARLKVIQLNATVEAMLAETSQKIAAGQGRTINLTTVPLTSQPVVDPATGKSNMKEMFHKGSTKEIADRIARALGGVRTSGAGYNIQTTKPKFAKGGIVPGTGNTDTYHTTAEAGAFVINKAGTEANMPVIENLLGGRPVFRNTGGQVPVVLTPGEAVIPPNIAQKNMPLMYALNGGPGNTSGMGRNIGGGISQNFMEGLKAWLERNADSNYDSTLKNRVILHDSAVLNNIGFSEDEAISMAKRDYEEALSKSKDLKTGRVNRQLFNSIRIEQARKMQDFIDMQGMGRSITNKDGSVSKAKYKDLLWKDKPSELKPGGRPQIGAVLPTRSLISTFMSRPDIDQVSMQKVINSFTRPDKTFDYASEHLDKDRNFFTEEDGKIRSNRTRGNAYLAQAGSSTINTFTNHLSRMTAGKFVDRVPLYQQSAQRISDVLAKQLNYGNASNLIKRMPVIERGHMITKMLRMLLTKGQKLPIKQEIAANEGGQISGQFAQKLFGGGRLFLGMPRTIKQVEAQRAAKTAMEKASQAVSNSRFSKSPVTSYDELIEPTSGRSFPVAGIGGLYSKGGDKVFVKPVLDEKAALAEIRATQIAREVHGLQTPNQKVVVMRDPTDPTGKRKLLALESKYNPAIANQDGKFDEDQYFRQLVASALRGDKDLGRGNLSGNILADVGPAGVFATASGPRDYSATIPSFKHQALVNLMGVKGSGAKKFFAESTADIPQGMTADQYNDRMLEEINRALPQLKKTISTFTLNSEEKIVYNKMIDRLDEARRQTYQDLHGVHSSLKIAPEKTMTPAAIAKMIAADELKRRQKGLSASLSDNDFKTQANGFNIGGMIGNVLKGKAMHRIGAGFGPTGAPKPSMYESAPWGVNSLSIEMAEKLFANSGLRKNTQKHLYDKFAAELAKEKPYGYVKMPDGTLKNGLEPDSLDAVIRMAASNLISDRSIVKQLSPIDKDILRKKYMNWDSKKDTPMTEALKKLIFEIQPREMGGPVNAGKPYLVGEKGPEIFVPKNAGGIVPNQTPIPQGYNAGGFIKMMIMQLLGFQGGSALGKMTGLPGGDMMGGMLGSMLGMGAMGMGGGGAKTPIASMSKMRAPMGATRAVEQLPIVGAHPGNSRALTAYGAKLEAAANSTSKLARFGAMARMAVTRLNVGVAIAATTFAIINRRIKDHNEHLRVGITQYGLTEEAAKKAGLKFTDYNSKLADTVKNIEAIRERNQLLYESMQDSGMPISMTIQEYKKLKKEVTEVYSDQIKLINQSKASDLPQVAIDIKTALMAAGLSADEASKKIFAMFKMSDQAEKAGAFTVGNRAFRNIKTGQDAAVAAIDNYVPASAEGGREGAQAVSTGLNAIDAGILDMVEQSKKAAKADKTGNTKALTQYQAQEAMLNKLNKLESSRAVLTAKTREEMIKQNPELKKIINPADTVVSLFEKMNLAAKGFTGDLSKLGAEAVSTLSKVADAVSQSITAANKGGFLKENYANLKRLTDQQKVLENAAKGQSVKAQINTREQLKNLQKQIDANNKLADSRLRALDAAKQESDLANEIAKKKIEYDAAIARGDTATAQQAGLDVKQLESTMQYNAQKKAIEDALKRTNAPLEARIQSINDGQQKLSDNAALAAVELDKLNKKIATERQKIDDVNKAMTTLAINAIAAGKELKDYLKTGTDENPNAGRQDAAGLVGVAETARPGFIPKVKQPTHPKARLTPVDVTDQALGLLGGVNDAVTKGLSAKGIEVKSMTGDIYINNKKMDVKGTANTVFKATASNPGVKSVTVGKGSTAKQIMTIDSMSLLAQGIDSSVGSVFTQGNQKYRITGVDNAYLRTMRVEKAGYGTMKLNPKVPTIVGDRGPEMAFGGMIIPNMAKIPYSTPRYDVKQASKMLEPVHQSSATGVINLTQNIYPSEGMNTDAFVRQVVSMTKQAIGQDAKLNAKIVGNPMNVSIKT